MMKSSLAKILLASSCSLLAINCASQDASEVGSSSVLPDGDCHDPEDTCDGGGGDDGGGDGGGGGGGGGDCGGDEWSCDEDLAVSVDANLELSLVGTGIYVGLDSCGGLALGGEFDASLDASATIDADDLSATITAVADGSLSISTGDGCTCDAVSASVIASASASALIEANVASCDLACDLHADASADLECSSDHDYSTCEDDGHDHSCEVNAYASAHLSCMAACEVAAHISASADLDADVNLDLLGEASVDAYVGAELDLELDALLDVDGNVLLTLE